MQRKHRTLGRALASASSDVGFLGDCAQGAAARDSPSCVYGRASNMLNPCIDIEMAARRITTPVVKQGRRIIGV
jgi:hypothetical protein